MKLQDLFESSNSRAREFIIRCWGKLLYLDYLDLPVGRSFVGSKELNDVIDDYLKATKNNDEEALEELDEWINDGCPMTNGDKILNRTTIDRLLSAAEHKAGKEMTLYRFDHTPNKLQPGSWISLTSDPDEGRYAGKRTEFKIDPDDWVIDTDGLADAGEFIVNTDVLLDKEGK